MKIRNIILKIKENWGNLLFIILVIFISIFTLITLTSNPSENSLLFGLSFTRLISIGIVLFSSLFFLGIYFQHKKKKGIFFNYYFKFVYRSDKQKYYFFGGLLFSFMLFLLININSDRMMHFKNFWISLQPIFIHFLILCCVYFFFFRISIYSNSDKMITKQKETKSIPIVTILLVIGIYFLLIAIILLFSTKGLYDTFYWNVAGVPILPGFIYLLFSCLFCISVWEIFSSKTSISKIPGLVLFLLIMLHSISVFQSKSVAKNFFVSEPTQPTFEIFPYSDAVWYDLSARSVVNGLGINFHTPTDKPFFETYLGILYSINQNNYESITNLNIIVLSLIPAFFFLIGTELKSKKLGLVLSIFSIFYEWTTFQSSGFIANIHWKLIMPEPLAQLFSVLIFYSLIKWFKTQHRLWICLAGLFVTLGAYTRPQSLMFFGGLILLLLLTANRSLRQRLVDILYGTASFVFSALPWVIYCKVVYDYIPLFSKFKWILDYRFSLTETAALINSKYLLLSSGLIRNFSQINGIPDIVIISLSHFLNNIVKALLILPYSLRIDNVPAIFTGIPYWQEGDLLHWNGDLPFVFWINLAILVWGLFWIISKNKRVGLIPLILMFCYFFGLAISRTSGSRYLVPVIWVIWFYYLSGLYTITESIAIFLFGKPAQSIKKTEKPITHFRTIHSLWLIVPLIAGFILPAVDALIPINSDLQIETNELQSMVDQSEIHAHLSDNGEKLDTLFRTDQINLAYGKIMYPRMLKEPQETRDYFNFTFSILGQHFARNLSFISLSPTISEINLDNLYFVISCKQPENKPDLPFFIQNPNSNDFEFSEINWQACLQIHGLQ